MKIQFGEKNTGVRVVFNEHAGVRFEKNENVSRISLGIRKLTPLGNREYTVLIRRVVREARSHRIAALLISVNDLRKLSPALSDEQIVEHAVQNWILADFEFNQHKTPPKEGWPTIESISFSDCAPNSSMKSAVSRGEIVAQEVNQCRILANMSAGEITPRTLAQWAKNAVKGVSRTTVTIHDKKALIRMKAGAILGVAKGSAEEPRLIVLEYKGGGKEAPIAFVGKGVTFDSGGINIKPSAGGSLEEMHLDMSGGAAAIHAFVALARLKVKKNIVAIIPSVENMVDGASYRPGDILTSMSGKTIEVINTDAEGRLILADALTYVQKEFSPRLIVDIATLTGAALVALGQGASAIMTKNPELQALFVKLGEESGDFVWPLPLWDVYKENLESRRADLANIPISQSRYGGAINGGMFLSAFVDPKQLWVHIDMAPRMTSIPSDQLAHGATGEPVRLLIALAQNY
ncbi:MAG: leucyl aminopeptidase [Patescibacteria group bacterium]